MDGVNLTPLRKIEHPKGGIFHAMKRSDSGFYGFGEAYFSTINSGETKGWKKHKEMVLNLIVLVGEVEFVVHDNFDFFSVKLSKSNYQRLTVQPGLWVAFKGLSHKNILLNLASIEHNRKESESVDLNAFNYDWSEL